MMRMSEFERHKRAADLLLDLRESYKMLDVFGAMLQDRGDTELATRIFRVTNIVGDCSNFLNNFVKISGIFSSDGVSVPIMDTDMKTGGRDI